MHPFKFNVPRTTRGEGYWIHHILSLDKTLYSDSPIEMLHNGFNCLLERTKQVYFIEFKILPGLRACRKGRLTFNLRLKALWITLRTAMGLCHAKGRMS